MNDVVAVGINGVICEPTEVRRTDHATHTEYVITVLIPRSVGGGDERGQR